MQSDGNFEVWPQASECVPLSKHISNKANTIFNYKYQTARPNSLRKDVEGHLLSAVQKKNSIIYADVVVKWLLHKCSCWL
jgi:hypothetical protein